MRRPLALARALTEVWARGGGVWVVTVLANALSYWAAAETTTKVPTAAPFNGWACPWSCALHRSHRQRRHRHHSADHPDAGGPRRHCHHHVCVSNAHGRVACIAIVVAAIVVTSIAVFLILRSAILVERRLGTTGLNVLTRVMGLILAAVAVQFIINGIADVVPQMLAGVRGQRA